MEIHYCIKQNQLEIEFVKFNSHLQKKIFLCSFDIGNHQIHLLQEFINKLYKNEESIYEENGMILHYLPLYRLLIVYYNIDSSTYTIHFDNSHIKNQWIQILRKFIHSSS
jgi:hypothetical protein